MVNWENFVDPLNEDGNVTSQTKVSALVGSHIENGLISNMFPEENVDNQQKVKQNILRWVLEMTVQTLV